MTNAEPRGSALSDMQCDAVGCERHSVDYPDYRQAPLQLQAASLGRIKLYRNSLRQWLSAPPGEPMPLPREFGLSLAAPSSDEALAMWGGGS